MQDFLIGNNQPDCYNLNMISEKHKISKLKVLKALEEITKAGIDDKIKTEPNKALPKIEAPKLERDKEIEMPFRPDRHNKGRRPVF